MCLVCLSRRDHVRLYSIIFRRFVASQMKPARVRFVKARLRIAGREIELENPAEIIEPGFLLLYRNIEKEGDIKGEEFDVKEVSFWRGSSKQLYTQADVIREMKARGIGRPSTYAVIISKLFERKYIKEKNGRLIPTKLGFAVHRYLRRFEKFVSEERTRKLYGKMEAVERGEVDYQEVLAETFEEIKEIAGSKG